MAHPDYLLDMLTSEQMTEWMAYDSLEPIGEWRADYRLGVLCALIVDIVQRLFARQGTHPPMVSPLDYMPDWSGDIREALRASERQRSDDGRTTAETVDEMKRLFALIATKRTARDAPGDEGA